MRAALLIVSLAACGGCGGSKPVTATPVEESVDDKKATTDAKSLVGEIYKTLGRTNSDGLMTLVGEKLVVLGPRKPDALGSRTDALVALKPYLETKLAVRSGGLVVDASTGGHSAWAVDSIGVHNERMTLVAVLSSSDDLWLVDAVALGSIASGAAIKTGLAAQSVIPPAIVAHASDASAAVERFTVQLTNGKLASDDLTLRDGAIAIGPAGDMTRGKPALTKAWAKRIKTHVRAALTGEVAGGTTKDGQLAWVAAPVVRFADGESATPMRVFAIYEHMSPSPPASEATRSTWRLVVWSESVAIDAAGAGAAYAKIEAPPIIEDAPKPVPKKPPPKKPPAKKR